MNEHKYFSYAWRYRKEDLKYCPRCGSLFSLEDIHVPNQPQLVCDNCRFVFYLDPKLAVIALVLADDRALLLRRAEEPSKGLWGLPGGYVERGHDVRAAICREIQEEAGIPAVIHDVVRTYSFPDHGIVEILFLATANSMPPRVNIESSSAAFFKPAEIPWDHLAFDTTVDALQGWIRGDYMAHLARIKMPVAG
jgi:ADP-ribose pyrophosphatase YjhB (NUDIX family)